MQNEWWYRFAIENKDAVNAAKLGCRISGNVLRDKELGMWIRAMGVQLKREQVKITDPDFEYINNKKSGSVTKRNIQSIFGINKSAMTFFLEVIQRRWQSGRTEYVAFANRLITEEQNAELAEIEAQLSSPTISHNLDEKTIQKTQEILIDIGRDQNVENAVAAFDAIEEQIEKH